MPFAAKAGASFPAAKSSALPLLVHCSTIVHPAGGRSHRRAGRPDCPRDHAGHPVPHRHHPRGGLTGASLLECYDEILVLKDGRHRRDRHLCRAGAAAAISVPCTNWRIDTAASKTVSCLGPISKTPFGGSPRQEPPQASAVALEAPRCGWVRHGICVGQIMLGSGGAVPASYFGSKAFALCDRSPASGSLDPPLAALTLSTKYYLRFWLSSRPHLARRIGT